MSIVRSPELGGLTDRKVRAAMFYSKKRRLARQVASDLVFGIAPVLATLYGGNLLTNAVTWTSPGFDGMDSIAKQMRVNSGPWVAFNAGQSLTTGEIWTVREFLQDANGNTKIFTSNTQEVVDAL